MKKIYFLFVIALIGTLFVMNSCELITNQNNQIEVPAIVSQVLSYDGQNLTSEGTADFADNGSYQELKKHLTNNKVISGFILKTIEDNAPTTGTLTKINSIQSVIVASYILDASNIWIADFNGNIKHSIDGGKTLVNQTNPSSFVIYGFSFIDALNGWTAGGGGTILHTSNGGVNWTIQSSNIGTDLKVIQFIDKNNGWAAGLSGTIIHTSDGGANWIQQNSGTSVNLQNIQFIDKNNGWAVGNSGTIVHTSDGGANWIIQKTDNGSDYNTLNAIQFIDKNNGWAMGNGGEVFHTTNGGSDWSSQNLHSVYNFIALQFVDANTGWALGFISSGTVSQLMSTTDGGNTWSATLINDSHPLSSYSQVKFFDRNSGFITGEQELISYSRTPKFNFQFTIKDVNNPSNILLTRNMENISITDWYTNPYTIVLTRAERDIVSNYFKNTSKFIYDISLVDDKITPFSFKLNMQTYLVSGMKLSTN